MLFYKVKLISLRKTSKNLHMLLKIIVVAEIEKTVW